MKWVVQAHGRARPDLTPLPDSRSRRPRLRQRFGTDVGRSHGALPAWSATPWRPTSAIPTPAPYDRDHAKRAVECGLGPAFGHWGASERPGDPCGAARGAPGGRVHRRRCICGVVTGRRRILRALSSCSRWARSSTLDASRVRPTAARFDRGPVWKLVRMCAWRRRSWELGHLTPAIPSSPRARLGNDGL